MANATDGGRLPVGDDGDGRTATMASWGFASSPVLFPFNHAGTPETCVWSRIVRCAVDRDSGGGVCHETRVRPGPERTPAEKLQKGETR